MAEPLKLAVIGHPVAHSLSPMLHGIFAEQAGISIEYDKVDAEPDAFVDTANRLRETGYAGANVTVPFKGDAFAYAEDRSEAAEVAQAVNTLAFGDTVSGDNTDGIGCVADLAALNIDLQDKTVVIRGAGGATRGILAPLAALGPRQLVVAGRTPYNAEALQEHFGPGSDTDAPVQACTYLALKGIRADVLIHASPAGHGGAMPRLPADLLMPGAPCYDLSYGQAHRVFADWAQAHGASTVHDGLGMLVEQGAASFRIWTGHDVDSRAALQALRAAA